MMRSVFVVLILLLFSSSAGAQDVVPASPVTLKELYFSALEYSETIAISDAEVRRAEALFRKSIGDAFPSFFYNRRVALEEYSKTGHDGYFEVVKTSFTGWGELAAIRAGNATKHQLRHERRRVEQLLLQDLAAAFYGLLLAQENVSASQKLVDLAGERAGELDKRVKLGKTRRADALGQEVLIGSFESQLEESSRQAAERRDLLSFLVAQPLGERSAVDTEFFVDPAPLESYLATAMSRPDVEAAKENINAFRGLEEVTRAEFLPGFGGSVAAYTDRATAGDEDVDWDATFAVSVPLWDWGSRAGALDAANEDVTESEKAYSQILRQAELEIRNAYRDYVSARKQLSIRLQSVEYARQDYELQAEDDVRGLVTSLDVLASLDRLNNAELAYNSARLEEKLAAINLKIASGSDPKDILQ